MKPIETERLVIRNWRAEDAADFHALNSDETVMAFFPFRRSRAECDERLEKLRAANAERGFGFGALTEKGGERAIGFVGIAPCDMIPGLADDSVEIGWRLMPDYWGRGYATEAAEALLDFGFEQLGRSEIFALAVGANRRSTAIMERIGMRYKPDLDFDHPTVPDDQPAIKPHVVYRITRGEWEARRA